MTVGAAANEKLYICPGETRPIPRSVHLSRLAAFFPNCRECPFRNDTGQLAQSTVERLQLTEHRVERESLFTTEGVRGVYINELTRSSAGRMAAALGRLLWQASPLTGQVDPPAARPASRKAVAAARRGSRPRRPVVVVGHDERPSSPDIVSGVAASLRRMGCEVIDVSLTTRPCFWFAVDHLEADAGVFVTGAGSPPSWSGLDFAGRQGTPLSQSTASRNDDGPPPLDLSRIEERLRQPFSRSTRHAGRYRTFQAAVPYEAGLWKHFHDLRPLIVACACPNRLTRQTLQRIFETLPCRLVPVDVPQRVRNPLDAQDPDVERVGAAVLENDAHLGILIDDDAQRCAFLDEYGEHVPFERIALLVGRRLLGEHPGETAVFDSTTIDAAQAMAKEAGGTAVATGETLAEMSRTMRATDAPFGGACSGRLWFRETFPTSDAILTLAHLLAFLSQGAAPLSEAAATA